MKNIIAILLLSFFFLQGTAFGQAQDPALMVFEQSIQDFFAHDNTAFSEAYASQGVQINPMGSMVVSPAAIFTAHEPLFNRYWKHLKSSVAILNRDVRYVSKDVAIVLLTAEYHHMKDGMEVDRGKGQVSGLLKKYGNDWKIELSQVTYIEEPKQGK